MAILLNKFLFLLWAVIAFAASPFAGNTASVVLGGKGLTAWQLTDLRKKIEQQPHECKAYQALVGFACLNDLLKAFVAQQERILLSENWVEKPHGLPGAFVQKITVPANAHIVTMGDLHGDSYSLDDLIACWQKPDRDRPAILDAQLRIRTPKTYIVGLGDYVDRADGGAEIWALLAQLKAANPNHVFLLRGNHENKSINESYGFLQELCCKYGAKRAVVLMDQFTSVYRCLPSALLVEVKNGSQARDCVLFCHGGIEVGIDLRPVLSSPAAQYQAVDGIDRVNRWGQSLAGIAPQEYIYASTLEETLLGFEWGDFCLNDERISYQDGRGLKADKLLTQAWLNHMSVPGCRVRAIVRAHQHGNDDDVALLAKNGGVYQLWDKTVTTVVSCMPLLCRMRQLGAMRTAFLALHVAPTFDQWRYQAQCTPACAVNVIR